MKSKRSFVHAFTAALLLVFSASAVRANTAPDFPPGTFTDGRHYSLKALRGRVVVLFFYEQGCPSCARKIPDRNKVVQQFRDQPVTFIAIAAGDTHAQAEAYVKRTGLQMPVFADKLSMMEKLYNTKISLNNIYQFRVIDPNGKVVGYSMDAATIQRALDKVQAVPDAYDPASYHEELGKLVALLNRGEHDDALRSMGRYLRHRDDAVKDSAKALEAAILAEAKGWVASADALVETDPFEAGRLYDDASDLFPREDFGVDAREKLKAIKSSQAYKDELAARKMFGKMYQAVDKMNREQVPELAQYARKIAEDYPDTPTGQRAAALATGLGG
ncbi:MAG: TlpA family protein disulfide reductase [Phycisphaeraceae bacterium]